MKKIMKTFILTILMLFTLSINCFNFAVTPNDFKAVDIDDSDKLVNAGSEIVSYIVYIGSFISLGMIIVLGIKYMMGSVEERAQYKKSMIPYFVGAICLFGASMITQIVYKIFTGMS